MDDISLHVVCYDISSDPVRAALANDLLDFGAREQNSVFEITVTKERFGQLLRILASIELGDEDSIVAYPIHSDAIPGIVRFGKERPPALDVLVF